MRKTASSVMTDTRTAPARRRKITTGNIGSMLGAGLAAGLKAQEAEREAEPVGAQQANTDWRKAYSAWKKADAARQKAYEAHQKAYAAWVKAYEAQQKTEPSSRAVLVAALSLMVRTINDGIRHDYDFDGEEIRACLKSARAALRDAGKE